MNSNNLPNYESIFGALDFKKGEEARSVYSPAAYLSDLLQFLDDYFENPDIDQRREDIKNIPLDKEKTFTLLPYLDIVNELLEKRGGGTNYEDLKQAVYPLHLPFNFDQEKVKLFLDYTGVQLADIYKLFHLNANPDEVARTALGLSSEMLNVLTDTTKLNVRELYGLKQEDKISSLNSVKRFLQVTKISGMELRALLSYDLSMEEEPLAAQFFTNEGLNGYAKLDKSEENIIWFSDAQLMQLEESEEKPKAMFPEAWFQRANRLLRLSKATNLSIAELGLILRSCCQNQLDKKAIHNIAVINQIAKKYDLAIDVCCSFFSPVNHIGFGNEDQPADLFNRIFNKQTLVDRKYFKVSNTLPKAFKKLEEGTELKWRGNLSDASNSYVRKRLKNSLGISDKDFKLINNRFNDSLMGKASADQKLSLFYRISQLANVMDISISELFQLLDLIQSDATIRKFSNFKRLISSETSQLDMNSILIDGSIKETMWLIQMLLSISEWLQSSQLSASDLNRIQRGAFKNEKEAKAYEQNKINGFNNLYQQFIPVFLQSAFFQTERFNQRAARVIFEAIRSEDSGIVAPKNKAILRYDAQKAKAAGYASLDNLQKISAKDFFDLGIEEKMRGKIFNNLIIKGYIQPDGTLIEKAFSNNQYAFSINSDGMQETTSVFNLIHEIYQEENSNGHSGNGESDTEEITIYRSDLDELPVDETRKTELYDNLIFNGYIDAEGNVIEPHFFAEKENVYEFDPNANIGVYSPKVYQLIQSKLDSYKSDSCVITKELFDNLGLKEIEKTDLLENLRFNDYLNEKNEVIDKMAFLKMDIKDFNLALMFYPFRHQIMEAIKQKLSVFKAKYYTLSEPELTKIAKEIVADLVYNHLKDGYLIEDVFSLDAVEFFSAEENINQLDIGNYFDDTTNQVVFKAIRDIISNASYYLLDSADLETLGIESDDAIDILDILYEKNYVEEDGNFTAAQTAFFLNINNALNFDLGDFEADAKDVFFMLNDMAVEVDGAVKEIEERCKLIADEQEAVLLMALQEMLEMPKDLITTVFRHVFPGNQFIVEAFTIPIFVKLDNEKTITQLPDDQYFNRNYNRIHQFGMLAAILGLNEVESDIIFRDQNLAEKFPENLSLADDMKRFDFILKIQIDGSMFPQMEVEGPLTVLMMYNGVDKQFCFYNADTYKRLGSSKKIEVLVPDLKGRSIDAAFNDQVGNAWMISGTDFYCSKKGTSLWEKKEKEFGKVQNNFLELEKIEASFMDQEGKIFLFSGDQYLRCTGELTNIDQGYPKKIKGNWSKEFAFQLPARYHKGIDAAFQNTEERIYFFKGKKFISSDDFNNEMKINKVWGNVKNNFADLKNIDATFNMGEKTYFFSGDQVLTWSDNMEQTEAFADEGSIQSINHLFKNLPEAFENGIDAIFMGFDQKIHIFKKNNYVRYSSDFELETKKPLKVAENWAQLKNNIAQKGTVSAAFSGLDGKAYIFSGNQYFRYSGMHFGQLDDGYPRTIETSWGGLKMVDAAFILDGKTYLFGTNSKKQYIHVRYSTNDYTKHDENYPKDVKDDWWSKFFNLPAKAKGFNKPDTIFLGKDGTTYLCKKNKYISYDEIHRWWTEPALIKDKWDGLPFKKIDAAFTGKDGRTYLFEGGKFVRYTDPEFNQIDDKYPQQIKEKWGLLKNNIETRKSIDAALTLVANETKSNDSETTTVKHQFTYLFSGNQYFRYSGDNYKEMDEGYPKNIVTSLKKEFRFKNLNVNFTKGIDAAFADNRNVFLVNKGTVYVTSGTTNKSYKKILSDDALNTFTQNGNLYFETKKGWQQIKSLEGNSTIIDSKMPPVLSDVPNNFQSNLNALLKGTDGNTYLFKGDQCYNDLLQKSYPINEEWGRVKNNITINSQIDAIFEGRDGKTYVFSGDQFVSYSKKQNSNDLNRFVDHNPKSIKEHWGGLENVHVAFVKNGITYLCDAPDENGDFRFLSYSSADYTKPDGPPELTDISWWGFPSSYIDDGFKQVNAVLFEEEGMLLLSNDQFIQLNTVEGIWNYPRPIDRIWRDFPFASFDDDETERDLYTAYTASNGNSYFFNEDAFTVYNNNTKTFTALQKNETTWGHIKNHITQSNRLDAAVVVHGFTYIFSADQYVRYSTDDYRFVDDNYPKNVLEHLKEEKGFEHLPEKFEAHFKAVFEAGNGISGVVSDERNVFIFEGKNIHVASSSANAKYDIQRLGKLRNNFQSLDRVDAAFVSKQGQTFLFSGDQYIRYTTTDYDMVDEGYPKSIHDHFSGEGLKASLKGIGYEIDAALQGASGEVYLFKNKKVYHPKLANPMAPIKEVIKIDEQPFPTPVDAAFMGMDGSTYFFKGKEYVRYSDINQKYIDEGFPKMINGNWGNLPETFESGIDGAFVFEGKTYFTKGKQHVRYSNQHYQQIDAIYPQPFKNRWNDWNDYLLNDIQLITEFEKLNNQIGEDYTLSDLLNIQEGYIKEPFKMLSEIFDWDIDQVKWIKQKNGFLSADDGMEVNFNIELILKMNAIFKMAQKMGTSPGELYNTIWVPLFKKNQWDQGADTLYRYLSLNNSDEDWKTISNELHDKMNSLKHGALLPYVIAKEPKEQIPDSNDFIEKDARDLFADMLIDVEMGNEAKTSKIKEAIAAMQLYIHRFFTNLESAQLKGTTDQDRSIKRDQMKEWWKWMKNYRVWEANRKVFLYPENYIRPELRDTKTPEFKALEETLMAGELNQEIVTKAYNDYLNKFSSIGNLKISGANVYRDSQEIGDHILMLFGHTHTDPKLYYYRTARFLASGKIIWDNWNKVSINLNSERVFPVYAFGRVLVFWTEIEASEETNPVILNSESTSTVNSNDKILKHRADVKYSFVDYNNSWITPQTLKKGVELDYKIEAAFSEDEKVYTFSGKYCMVSTPDNLDGEIREIKEVFKHINPYFHSGIDAVAIYDNKKYFFRGPNVAVENGPPYPIKDYFRNDDKDIFVKFDANFPYNIRCRPRTDIHPPQEYQKGVAAAFVQGDTICLIDLKGGFTFYKKSVTKASAQTNASLIVANIILDNFKAVNSDLGIEQEKSMNLPPYIFESNPDIIDLGRNSWWFAFLKIITNDFLRLDPVDAIFKDKNNVLYFLRKGLYDCYLYDSTAVDKSKQLQKVDGFPKPIKGNLAFNMDKFFNKLHVVRSWDENGEFINLSYITPNEGALLLNGKITSDFKFKEGSLRVDSNKLNALLHQQKVAAAAPKYIPKVHTELVNKLKTIQKAVVPNAYLDDVKDLEIGLSKIKEAVALIDGIVITNQDKEEKDFKIEPGVKSNITNALNNAKDSLENAKTKQIQKSATKLAKAVKDVIVAFGKFEKKKTDTNLIALSAARESLVSNANKMDLNEDLTTIKSSLDESIGNSKSFVIANIEYHTSIYNSYQSMLNNLNQFLDDRDTIGTGLKAIVSKKHREIKSAVDATKDFKEKYEPIIQRYGDNLNKVEANWPASLTTFTKSNTSNNLGVVSKSLSTNIKNVITKFNALDSIAKELNAKSNLSNSISLQEFNNLQELYFGKFDLFPTDFGIENQGNFTFGEPDWYVFEAKKGTFLAKPLNGVDDSGVVKPIKGIDEFGATIPKYEIIRLTTTTIPEISNRLFAGGVKSLLTLETQELDEKPYFNTAPKPDSITYKTTLIEKLPESDKLDYRGANSNYYWEMFFHAPFLIAQNLNTAQKFDEAKEWYEYIFDPTRERNVWQFLPLNTGPLNKVDFPMDLEEYISQTINISDLAAEMKVYQDDPFDPHAIARLREVAYKKAIVMRYIDNLLDWGDMLFGQYTMESINEARMLYVLAYDLLGKKPESMGKKILSETTSYNNLKHEKGDKNDLLLKPTVISVASGTVNESVASPYFHIPSNTLFHDYWNRVEDRLFKIRNSLNIDGIKQALPLFQPPIDPMSIVQAIGSGASLAQALAGGTAAVPHYRFNFMLNKARELVGKLTQFSGELLSAIEKKDAEEVEMIQRKQEAIVLSMMTKIKEAQLEEAKESINALNANMEMVKANEAYNKDTFETGYLPIEIAQYSTMSVVVGLNLTSSILKIISSAAAPAPEVKIGIDAGPAWGGEQVSRTLSEASEAIQTAGEGLSIMGEMFGMSAQHQRMMDDTKFAWKTAKHDIDQINSQMESAKIQIKVAEYELAMHHKDIAHQESINTFMKSKFSNVQLYQWMTSQLSGLYYQAYKMALDLAKSAEKAYQFERGLKESEVNYVKGTYWNSQRKGLMAGEQLGMDLDRMEMAYLKTNKRRFEITKNVPLLTLNPRAFLQLKSKGVCEFDFTEAFFDYDFPGHYCRQIKTISIAFEAGETVNATLTQLSNKVLLKPDPKAVKFLLDPKDKQPDSIRTNWRPSQQIALSFVDEYETGNGLFELRMDDEQYIPFEGTGAISRWRLELNGKRGALKMEDFMNLTITIKYTALPGGEGFKDAVKGMLKPYYTAQYFSLATDFADDWNAFMENEDADLVLNLEQAHFPNMASSKITGIFSRFEVMENANVSFQINGDDSLLLKQEKMLDATGLSVSSRGSTWRLKVKGDKQALKNVLLIVGYKAKV